MNKRILLQLLLCLFLSYHAKGQCPEATEAILTDVVNNNDGTCSFSLEVLYNSGGEDNSSLVLGISIEGGAKLLDTDCFGNIKNGILYTEIVSDPALVAPCDATIIVTYTSWQNAGCGGSNNCAVEVEVPVLGALPVDLVSFTGYTEKYDQIKLEWLTASEENNAYFVVEHSTDGRTFEALGVVQGNGTSFLENHYSFMDESPNKGENYYRLKQTNFDQTFEHSKIISVNLDMDFSTPLTISPSVAENQIDLIFHELPKANRYIEIFSTAGQNMINTQLEEGAHILNLDISDYEPGMYFIRVPIGREYVIKKFIKIRD